MPAGPKTAQSQHQQGSDKWTNPRLARLRCRHTVARTVPVTTCRRRCYVAAGGLNFPVAAADSPTTAAATATATAQYVPGALCMLSAKCGARGCRENSRGLHLRATFCGKNGKRGCGCGRLSEHVERRSDCGLLSQHVERSCGCRLLRLCIGNREGGCGRSCQLLGTFGCRRYR